MDDQRLLELMQGLSGSLTSGDLDHTLSRITQAAVEVLPDVEFASITVLHADGRLETVAPTDELLWGVDAAQYELREGPCYEAAADAVHVVSPDLANDLRFPRYAVTAVAAGSTRKRASGSSTPPSPAVRSTSTHKLPAPSRISAC